VSLLQSAPSGPGYIDIVIFVLCLHGQLFCSNVRFRMQQFLPCYHSLKSPRVRAFRSRRQRHCKPESQHDVIGCGGIA
jgi:hypothetical protein